MHPAALPIEELLRQCKVFRTKGSGPGGQHRNKTETAITVTHSSGVVGQASETRSQDTNRVVAIHRLRLNLAVQVRAPMHDAVSQLWKQRFPSGRIVISVKHTDFPAILAEALDCLEEHAFELAASAGALGTNSAQLTKLLRLHAPALEYVNRNREEMKLHPLL